MNACALTTAVAGWLLLAALAEAQQPDAAAHFGTPVAIADQAAVAERAIDLEAALTLAGVDNPTIALAREAVQASLAEQLQARVLLLPTLDAGMDYNLHRGNLQSSQGIIRDVNRQSLYLGGGAAAVGAGSVGVPGVRLTAHLADALFEPRATRQAVIGRQFDALATRNTILLNVTNSFFALVGAEANLQAVRQSETEAAQVAQMTANFARTGQGSEADADRARTSALLVRSMEERAEEEVAVTGAELARLLSTDPATRFRVPGGPIPVVQLVDPDADLEALVQIAVRNRPEVGARSADVAVVATRLRKERVRPLLPFITVGFSAGEFGGGSDQTTPRFGSFNGRTDFDALAVWSLQNLGLGNLAVQRRLRAQVGEAEAERMRVIDLIRREVAEAYALSAARLRALDVTRREVERAQRAFREDLLRTRNLEGKPIETLHSLNQLVTARQALIAALIAYDQAQFQLFVALGQPPP
jgi:outer membrane protein TolC